MKRQPTPLDMLMAEQRRVRESCRVQEQKINEDFKFIHDHSGRILFAGISSLFFSRNFSYSMIKLILLLLSQDNFP